MHRILLIAAGCFWVVAWQPARADRRPEHGPPQVSIERVPNNGLQPQIAVDSRGALRLVYFAGEPGAGDLWYVKRAPSEHGFSKPIAVNSQKGSAVATGTIRGAQIALGQGDLLHVAWNGSAKAEPKGPGRHAFPMLYARVSDDEATFEPQRNLIQHAYGLDGGGSLAADRRGNVAVVWHAGESGEARRRVWLALSEDNGRTFQEERAIDANEQGACGCCGLKAFADRQGGIYVLYRSARDGQNRDMELLAAASPAQPFTQQRVDRWKVAACPMSAEAFAETGNAVLAAWETEGQVWLARIEKGTARSAKPVAAPGRGRNRKHPALAVNAAGDVLLAWTEGTGWQRGGDVAWQVFDARGRPTAASGRGTGLPAWSFPAAYAEADGSFVVMY
jgi:hypothetical protein